MREVRLSRLMDSLDVLAYAGAKDPLITDLTLSSKEIRRGSLFFAIEGQHTDGHLFVEEARSRGAVGVVHTRPLPQYHGDTAYIRVSDGTQAFSSASDSYYGHPSREMTVVGITGTDGKSTTVWFLYQLLAKLGKQVGFISSTNLGVGGKVTPSPFRQSTPEASEVHRLLRTLRDNDTRYALLEATSHGLSRKTKRLQDVLFDVAVLTNVSREHLEFHGSIEQYRNDKANLFRQLGKGEKNLGSCAERLCFGVVNRDDPHHDLFARATRYPVYSYSLEDPTADLSASDIRTEGGQSRFELHFEGETVESRLPHPGRFNIANVMAASLTLCRLLDLPLSDLAPHYGELLGVRGRMEAVDEGQPFRVIVDFAHTPSSFRELFAFLEEERRSAGRIIVVFGSAGERDTGKRVLQGRIASEKADVVVLTDEDPRGEDREKILKEIADGCIGKVKGSDLLVIPDRNLAIRRALELAQPGDTVLCLGKGHENSIIYAEGPIPWDEAAVVRGHLRDLSDRWRKK
jgi:UDP-N-acetylmuramoyl-L-alanyl-D-glutamate--2,6-diaminopimelate ligase